MFTGIVQDIGSVIQLNPLGIELPNLDEIALGASVAIDGVCLTVVQREKSNLFFDVIEETRKRTTLGSLTVGDLVNVERSLKVGDEVGGHLLSGHIMGVAPIGHIDGNIYHIELPSQLKKYVFEKGYIAINGISLTVVEPSLTVHLIPETLKRTTLAVKKVGDLVNIEIDATTQAIVQTVERMQNRSD